VFLYWGWDIDISRKIITFENLCPPALRVKVIRAELLIDIPVKEYEVKTHKNSNSLNSGFRLYKSFCGRQRKFNYSFQCQKRDQRSENQ